MPKTTLYRQYARDFLAGNTSYRLDFPDPAEIETEASERFATYRQLLAYYNNTAFDEVAKWARYRLNYNLYRYTRNIFNPVARVVNFYADHIYPGVLSVDGKELPNGVQSAIPLSHDTPKELANAIGQTWKWSNWQSRRRLPIVWGGITGNVLIELIDDIPNQRVIYRPMWAEFVPKIRLNEVGELDAYVIEYDAIDPSTGEHFLFGKEVQATFIAYYRDRQLQRAIENPYGFVPAVWIKHEDFGGDFGIPAIGNSRGKIDEVNSIVSHTADHIHKQINSPRVMWSSGTIKNLFTGTNEDPDFSTTDFDARRDTLMLKGPQDGKTETLVGNLDPQTIVPIIQEILLEIKEDFPEITMYQKLREMNQVTGPAATKMMGDVDNKLRGPAANHDSGSARLFAMAVAMAGFRVNSGAWGNELTPAHKLFGAFDLTAYNRGELLATILPRPLVTETTKDVADEMFVRAQAVNQVREDVPMEAKFKMLGYREDEIKELVSKMKAEMDQIKKDKIMLAKASKPAPAQQPQNKKPSATQKTK